MRRRGTLSLISIVAIVGLNLATAPPTGAVVTDKPCVDGFADVYPCHNVDLLAFLSNAELRGPTATSNSGNDVWGWTDPLDGDEYALMGLSNGTAFVDISDPVNPVYLGTLPTHTLNSSWRDIKVYDNHAFIVSEATQHGMQVFDLTQLRNPPITPMVFLETAHYRGFSNAHNIVINEETGFAYAVGTNTCSGGLHMVDIRVPTSPTSAGCFSGDGYTHDAQCVIYRGWDKEHVGKEICFAANEDSVTIVDVTDKSAPVLLSRTTYAFSRYTHQGWLTEDHKWFVVNDELDESTFRHNTRTRYFKVMDLEAPTLEQVYDHPTQAIDHNLYIKGRYVFEANYRAGLRILRLFEDEVAYFDIYPANDARGFNGAWSNYPFFDSGVVLISGIEQGLFIVRPHLQPPV